MQQGSKSRTEQNIINATKVTRSIQLGWCVWNQNEGKYKQLRKPHGGGTRVKDIQKDATKFEIHMNGVFRS